jgi:kynurenine formamidase
MQEGYKDYYQMDFSISIDSAKYVLSSLSVALIGHDLCMIKPQENKDCSCQNLKAFRLKHGVERAERTDYLLVAK